MPIVKVPKTIYSGDPNKETSTHLSLSKFLPVELVVPPRPPIYMQVVHNRVQAEWLFPPSFLSTFEIYNFNSDTGQFNYWFTGTNGGAFFVTNSGMVFFRLDQDPGIFSPESSLVTGFTYHGMFEGNEAFGEVICTVTYGQSDIDPYWDDVEFLYQLPPAVYSITDRKIKHDTVKVGIIDWQFNHLFSGTFSWNTATKSYLRIGATDVLRGYCNGSFSWTFDAWVYPYYLDGPYLFAVSENTTGKNQLILRYIGSNLDIQLFNLNKYVFSMTIPSIDFYTWQHIAVTLDVISNVAKCFLNGQLMQTYNLNLPFVDQKVTFAYLGIDDPLSSWFYQGKMAAARLTKAVRWTEDFKPPCPVFPEVGP